MVAVAVAVAAALVAALAVVVVVAAAVVALVAVASVAQAPELVRVDLEWLEREVQTLVVARTKEVQIEVGQNRLVLE